MSDPVLRVLGVDPGLSGAVVLYTPTTGEVVAKRDFKGIHAVARAVRDLGAHATFAIIEYVSARPGQGVTSMFHFGQSTGVPMGIFECLDIPWIDVVPQTWIAWVKEYVGMDKLDPFNSCEAALQCAPPACHKLFSRAKDHNTADAFFLALWGAVHADARPEASGRNGSQTRLPMLEQMFILQRKRAARLKAIAAHDALVSG